MSVHVSSSRRSMLAALGVSGLGLALAPQLAGAGNRNAALAEHPFVGVWLVQVTPPSNPDVTVAVTSIYTADGLTISAFPATEMTPGGVMHRVPALGVWEAFDDRTAHVTMVLSMCSSDGAFAGSTTYDVFPQVNEDGQSFEDNNPKNVITIRDAANAVVREIRGGSPRPVRGYRITPGHVGFPESEADVSVRSRYPVDPRTP